MMKKHIDQPRKEEFDREAVLNFYDTFSELKEYKGIETRHFKIRPNHDTPQTKDKTISAHGTLFGITGDMDTDSSDEDSTKLNPTTPKQTNIGKHLTDSNSAGRNSTGKKSTNKYLTVRDLTDEDDEELLESNQADL